MELAKDRGAWKQMIAGIRHPEAQDEANNALAFVGWAVVAFIFYVVS